MNLSLLTLAPSQVPTLTVPLDWFPCFAGLTQGLDGKSLYPYPDAGPFPGLPSARTRRC